MNLDPKTLFDIFGTLGMIIAAITFAISQVRANDMKLLRGDNKDLRDSLKDKSEKIDDLEAKVDLLEKKVAVLETKNNDLAILVKEALLMYFTRNPKVAEKIQEEQK